MRKGQAPAQTSTRRNRRPRWLRILRLACRVVFIALAAVLLLVAALPYVTDTALVRGILRARISKALGGATVELERIRLAPLDGDLLRLEGLEIGPPGEEGNPLLSVANIRAQWNPFALLGRKLDVSGVQVSGVSVRLVEKDGKWNFASLIPPPQPEEEEPKAPKPLDLSRIELPASLRLQDVSFSGITAEVESERFGHMLVGPLSGWVRAEFDEQAMGELEVSYRLDRIMVQTDRPVRAGLELAAQSALKVSRSGEDGSDLASLKVSVRLNDICARVEGAVVPLRIQAEMAAAGTFDLAGPGVPELRVSFRVPELLEDSALATAAEADGAFQVDVRNSLSVEASGLAALIEQTAKALQQVPQVASAVRDLSVTADGTVQAESALVASLQLDPSLMLEGTLSNRITARGIDAKALVELNRAGAGLGRRIEAGLDRIEVDCHHEAHVALAGGASITSQLDVAATGLSVFAGLPGVGHIVIDNPSVSLNEGNSVELDLAGEGDSPAAALSVSFKAGAQEVAFESPYVGRIGAPFWVGAELSGENLASSEESVVNLSHLAGSVGEVVPEFSLTGSAEGYGARSLDVSGRASLDLGGLLAMREGIDAALKPLLVGLAVDGSAEGRFRLSGALPRQDGGGPLSVWVSAQSEVKSASLARKDLVLSLAETAAKFEASLDLPPGFIPEAALWQAKARLGPVALAAGGRAVRLEGLNSSAAGTLWLQTEAGRLPLDRASVGFEAQAAGLAVTLPRAGGAPISLGPVDLQAAGMAGVDLNRGDLDLTNAHFALPGLLSIDEAEVHARGYGVDGVNARGQMEVPELADLIGFLGDALVMPLPQVSGSLGINVAVGGRLPAIAPLVQAFKEGAPHGEVIRNALSSLTSGEPWPQLRLSPVGDFYRNAMPLSMDLDAHARGLAIQYQVGPQLAVGAEGLSADLSLGLHDGDFGAEASASIPSVVLSPLPVRIRDIRCSARMGLEDFDRLHVSDMRLSVMDMVALNGDLDVGGLGAMRPGISVTEMAESLDVVATGALQFTPEAVSALEGWGGSGRASSSFRFVLERAKSMGLVAELALEDVSLTARDLFHVQGLNARFAMSKRWQLVTGPVRLGEPGLSEAVLSPPPGAAGRGGAGREESSLWVQRGLDPTTAWLLKPAGGITVQSISLLGRELAKNADLRVALEPGSVRVSRLRSDILGGQLLGRMGAWMEDDTLRVFAETEFDGIDMRDMLPPELRDFRGDSSVSGTARADVFVRIAFSGSQPGNPLKQMTGELELTHIGSQALDRALMALDPQSQDPKLLELRGKLKLGSPKQVRAQVKGAFVDVSLQLQGPAGVLVSDFTLPRFSVAEAFQSDRAMPYFGLFAQVMALARQPMHMLRAGRIVLPHDGLEVKFLP